MRYKLLFGALVLTGILLASHLALAESKSERLSVTTATPVSRRPVARMQSMIEEEAVREAQRRVQEQREVERFLAFAAYVAAIEEAERQAAAQAEAEAARRAAEERKAREAAVARRKAAEPPTAAPSPPSGDVWYALAQCESGGNWSINTGNGYSGGLQFSLSSWRAVGGTGYPHEHSAATQIEMGKRLQARQGWGAWPACSRKLGLR